MNKILIVAGLLLSVSMAGCQTVEYRHGYLEPLAPIQQREGIYHKVNKGETLWRIAQTYHVGVDEIIRSNNIPNAALIEANQLLFIPGASQMRPVVLPDGGESDDFSWPIQGRLTAFFNDKQGLYVNRDLHQRHRELLCAV